MLKNICKLEHMIESKVFQFVCDQDAPLHFIKEALFQMQKYIGQVEDAALANQKAAQVEIVADEKPDEPQQEG